MDIEDPNAKIYEINPDDYKIRMPSNMSNRKEGKK